jgi:hypothetical protein
MSSLQGVRGWLLFLCVILTIWNPLSVLAEIGKQGRTIATASTLEWCLIALSAYGVYAGVSLWRVAIGAVRKAQLYFYISVFVAVVFTAIALLSGSYNQALSNIVSIAGCSAWLAYLGDSKRVMATYSLHREPLQPQPVPDLTR